MFYRSAVFLFLINIGLFAGADGTCITSVINNFDFSYVDASWIRLIGNAADGMRNYISNVAEGIKENNKKHISLAKVSLQSMTNHNDEKTYFLPYVFVSGIVPETIRQDIVGSVKDPTLEAFMKIFINISSAGFSCKHSQAQQFAHSERAACFYILNNKNEINEKLGANTLVNSSKLVIDIYNIKYPCSNCKSFFEGVSKIKQGNRGETTILLALKEMYKVQCVKINVHFDENELYTQESK